MDARYSPLPDHPLPAGATVRRRLGAPPARVALDAPARAVMTDLTEVDAVSIAPDRTLDAALERMKAAGVRLLFVTDAVDALVGVITATDIAGEKPVRFQHQTGADRREVLVRDIMTPLELLEALRFDDVERACVGDVLATLRHLGRQHALVVERDRAGERVRGLFSTSRLAAQLGVRVEVGETAHTFAQIESALRS